MYRCFMPDWSHAVNTYWGWSSWSYVNLTWSGITSLKNIYTFFFTIVHKQKQKQTAVATLPSFFCFPFQTVANERQEEKTLSCQNKRQTLGGGWSCLEVNRKGVRWQWRRWHRQRMVRRVESAMTAATEIKLSGQRAVVRERVLGEPKTSEKRRQKVQGDQNRAGRVTGCVTVWVWVSERSVWRL